MKRKEERGFLLIEALAAILILSIAMVAAAGVFSRSLQICARTDTTLGEVGRTEQALFEMQSGMRLGLPIEITQRNSFLAARFGHFNNLLAEETFLS